MSASSGSAAIASADAGDAWRVGQREVFTATKRRGDPQLDLSAVMHLEGGIGVEDGGNDLGRRHVVGVRVRVADVFARGSPGSITVGDGAGKT